MKVINKVKKKYTENKEHSVNFVPEHIMKKSVAVASLAKWINALIEYRCLLDDPNYVAPEPVN